MTEEAYKLAKEAHVANCTGGTINEVSMVCGSIVVSLYFFLHFVFKMVFKGFNFVI